MLLLKDYERYRYDIKIKSYEAQSLLFAEPYITSKNVSVFQQMSGDKETRTPDPLRAKQVLYQLSYIPA